MVRAWPGRRCYGLGIADRRWLGVEWVHRHRLGLVRNLARLAKTALPRWALAASPCGPPLSPSEPWLPQGIAALEADQEPVHVQVELVSAVLSANGLHRREIGRSVRRPIRNSVRHGE
jgi:hypothetical protein